MEYLQTFMPTLAAASVKIVMAVAHQYKVYHLDVAKAFANFKATLDYEVCMKLPGGCGDLSGKYVRFEKALYGRKQNGLLWNDLLVVKLVTVHGMEQCKSDPCVFRLVREVKVVLILAVHVQDMAVADSRGEVHKLLVVLNENFTTNDLGELSFFMGCVFSQDLEKGMLSMTQTAFIETLARIFYLTTTFLYPASPDAKLGARMEGESSSTWPYREVVEGLMWLVVMTRPDIGDSVRAVARQSHNPTARHRKAMIQIIQYLLGTRVFVLRLNGGRD